MSSRIATASSLLAIFLLAQPAGAADKMSVKSLGARLAANPAGEEARALADDIRAWFGKDRAAGRTSTAAPARRSRAWRPPGPSRLRVRRRPRSSPAIAGPSR